MSIVRSKTLKVLCLCIFSDILRMLFDSISVLEFHSQSLTFAKMNLPKIQVLEMIYSKKQISNFKIYYPL